MHVGLHVGIIRRRPSLFFLVVVWVDWQDFGLFHEEGTVSIRRIMVPIGVNRDESSLAYGKERDILVLIKFVFPIFPLFGVSAIESFANKQR